MINIDGVRRLRVTGLPPEMARIAIHALICTDRAVRCIEAKDEPGAWDPIHTVHVVVEDEGFHRILRKLETGFAAITIEEVTAAVDRSTRARSDLVGRR